MACRVRGCPVGVWKQQSPRLANPKSTALPPSKQASNQWRFQLRAVVSTRKLSEKGTLHFVTCCNLMESGLFGIKSVLLISWHLGFKLRRHFRAFHHENKMQWTLGFNMEAGCFILFCQPLLLVK